MASDLTATTTDLTDYYSPNKAADEQAETVGVKPKPNVARTISYVLGGLAVALILASIVMLVFLRNKSTVITTVIPSAHLTPTPALPLPAVKVQPLDYLDTFDVEQWRSITTPVATVTEVSPVWPSASATVTLAPDSEPGMVPFPDTINFPLQSAPQGFGWVVLTPAADQWFSSLPNGYARLAQYLYTSGKFTADSDAYQDKTQNSIAFCVNDPANAQNDQLGDVNTAASSVGSVGFASMAMSLDGTRLYVGYRQPIMGATADAQIFPFLQLSGQMATFTRPTDPAGGLPTSTNWTYACSLELANPYGSQTAQFDQICDPITGQLLTGDDFASILRTTTNLTNGNRVIAARSNFGLRVSDGAFVSIFEETANNTYAISGIVYLFDGTTTFTLAEKLSFGRDFALGNDALLCAVRTPTGGCGVTTDRYNVFFFQRNDATLQWEYQQTLLPPDTAVNEDFGVSIVMNAAGTQAIIGSPHLPSGATPGLGGNVYFYQRTHSTWALTQTFSDPLASVHTQGAFGYFLAVDQLFLVLAISANQNNVLNAPKTIIGDTPTAHKPSVVFVAIDQTNAELDATNAQQQAQPDENTSDYLDPLLGAGMSLQFEDLKPSTLHILLPSPMNQKVFHYTMSVS